MNDVIVWMCMCRLFSSRLMFCLEIEVISTLALNV